MVPSMACGTTISWHEEEINCVETGNTYPSAEMDVTSNNAPKSTRPSSFDFNSKRNVFLDAMV
jgi:hypothetical protein